MLYSVFRASWRVAHYLCLLAFLTLAFDVGRDCGLDFSLWLVSWYVATVVLRRVFSQQGPVKVVVKTMRMAEPVVILALLLLAIFRATKGGNTAAAGASSRWIWEAIIRGSDPVLTLLEGFGTVLIIQKSSQVVRRLANRSDGYQMAFLVLSATVYVISAFGLYQLYAASSPELVPSVKSASVIGCCMTLTIVISIVALASGRGVITDTAFLFAYMVMSMYIAARNEAIESAPTKTRIMPLHSAIEFGQLSIPYLQSLSLQDVEKITIQTLVHLSQLVQVLLKALSPNILISLVYRMGVLMAVAQIAPTLNIGQDAISASSSSNGHAFRRRKSTDDITSLDDDDDSSTNGGVMPFLASMAKPVLLMTHTRILLQYFGYLKPALAIWGWLNSFLCLALFAAELVLARDDVWDHYRSD